LSIYKRKFCLFLLLFCRDLISELLDIFSKNLVEIASVASKTISARRKFSRNKSATIRTMYLFNLANYFFLTLLRSEFPVFQHYTYEEIRDIHIMYICTEMDSQRARFLYHRLFPNRRLPDQEHFTLLHNRFVRFVLFCRYENSEPPFPIADLYNRQT